MMAESSFIVDDVKLRMIRRLRRSSHIFGFSLAVNVRMLVSRRCSSLRYFVPPGADMHKSLRPKYIETRCSPNHLLLKHQLSTQSCYSVDDGMVTASMR